MRTPTPEELDGSTDPELLPRVVLGMTAFPRVWGTQQERIATLLRTSNEAMLRRIRRDAPTGMAATVVPEAVVSAVGDIMSLLDTELDEEGCAPVRKILAQALMDIYCCFANRLGPPASE